MFPRCSSYAALLLIVASNCAVRAEVFYTGRVTANGDVVAGGVEVANAKQIFFAGGGASFTNVFGSGAAGAARDGDRVTAVGFLPLSGAIVGNSPFTSFNTVNQLVLVYALQGQVEAPGPTGATYNFRSEDGGSGVMGIFVRGSGTLLLNDASTWVPNIGNLNVGRVATLGISEVPSAVAAGSPGPPATFDPLTNVAFLNFVVGDYNLPGNMLSPEFILDVTNPGTFFTNFLTVGGSPGVLLLLSQSLGASSLTQDDTQIGYLNQIIRELFGNNALLFAANAGNGGDSYTPNSPANAFTGDVSLNNNGGFAVPGALLEAQVVPEPGSLMVWGIVSLLGGAISVYRQRKR